jgi:hypothetical protein
VEGADGVEVGSGRHIEGSAMLVAFRFIAVGVVGRDVAGVKSPAIRSWVFRRRRLFSGEALRRTRAAS